MSITRKILFALLGGLLSLAIILIALVVWSLHSLRTESQKLQRDEMTTQVKQRLSEQVDIARDLVAHYGAMAAAEPSRKKEFQERAIANIMELRWDGGGYFFVYDFDGNVVVEPPRPDLAGKNLIDKKDTNGVFYIKEMIELA